MKNLFFVMLMFLISNFCIAQDFGNYILANPVDGKKLVTSAETSLKDYVTNFINESNAKRFGFSSKEEAKNAKVGSPVQELMIGLKDLQKYDTDSDPKQILIDLNTWWFPVLVGNDIKTKIEMIERDGKMIAGEFGGIKLVSIIVSMKQVFQEKLIENNLRPSKSIALLKIPSLGMILLLADVNGTFYVIPASGSLDQYNLKQNEMLTLREALSRIKVVAVNINPDLVM
jgi:hypothetical protein